jgi:hypothetical protein
MTSPATKAALDAASRKAGVGEYRAPNNTSRNVIAAVAKKAGTPEPSPPARDLSPGPSGGEFGHHLVDPSKSAALDHRERAQQQAREAAERRKHVIRTEDNRGPRA